MVETPHFRIAGGRIHPRLERLTVDNDLGDHLVSELGPLGLVVDVRSFERAFVSVVLRGAPTVDEAWARFYRNTLRGLRDLAPLKERMAGTIATFARIYRQVADLVLGASVVDVGSCFGFLPLLLCERSPDLTVVGVDISPPMVALAGQNASGRASRTRFVAADGARLPFGDATVGTVVAAHVLEHLPASRGTAVVTEMARVARERVIVTVPLENTPAPVYGHVRAFSLDTLRAMAPAAGWRSSVWESDGGWLLADRAENAICTEGTSSTRPGPPHRPEEEIADAEKGCGHG
ncbi:MAG: Methyltransferase domain [Chloroflexi bacterium]|jgi:SAM-dependent methyltransferase|nr:Methyltransferase domain [Chloroflexota bacterium]